MTAALWVAPDMGPGRLHALRDFVCPAAASELEVFTIASAGSSRRALRLRRFPHVVADVVALPWSDAVEELRRVTAWLEVMTS